MKQILWLFVVVLGVVVVPSVYAEDIDSTKVGGFYEPDTELLLSAASEEKCLCPCPEKAPRERTKKMLTKLREGTTHYEALLRVFRQEVGRAGLPLKEFGTSEEELGELQSLGARKAANAWYAYFLGNPDKYEIAFAHIRKEAAKGEFNPETIGDPLKTKQMILLGSWLIAQRCVHKMREEDHAGNTVEAAQAAQCVRKQTQVGGHPLSELGVDEAELRYGGKKAMTVSEYRQFLF